VTVTLSSSSPGTAASCAAAVHGARCAKTRAGRAMPKTGLFRTSSGSWLYLFLSFFFFLIYFFIYLKFGINLDNHQPFHFLLFKVIRESG